VELNVIVVVVENVAPPVLLEHVSVSVGGAQFAVHMTPPASGKPASLGKVSVFDESAGQFGLLPAAAV
jgi:predicted RNA-binding protein with PUA domain